MFYWRVQGRQLVLTDAEEGDVLKRAGLTASDRVRFRVAGKGANELRARVGRWLEDYARRDPDAFDLEFFERRGVGPEHLPELRALIEAYRQTTGRALWGWPEETEPADELGAALWLAGRPDAVFITLTRPTMRWFRRRYEYVGLLAFPGGEIERFAGNETEFVLFTTGMAVRFGPDLVRIITMPEHQEAGLP